MVTCGLSTGVFDCGATIMSEFWLIVTLCAIPAISDTPYEAGRPILSSDCAEYRVETSFTSIQACRLHQIHLNNVSLEPRQIMASLCTARLDPARLEELPLLSTALGDHA
jgi:hypothetical protein